MAIHRTVSYRVGDRYFDTRPQALRYEKLGLTVEAQVIDCVRRFKAELAAIPNSGAVSEHYVFFNSFAKELKEG